MNPANYNFCLSAFKENESSSALRIGFPWRQGHNLGICHSHTSALPRTISYLPPWAFFLLFYCTPESRGGWFHPLYLGSPEDQQDNQLCPQGLYNWVCFEVWFHGRGAAAAIQETKAGVKQEENEQPQPHFRKHVWVHMKWAGTMALKSLPPSLHTALFPHIPPAPTFPRDSRRVLWTVIHSVAATIKALSRDINYSWESTLHKTLHHFFQENMGSREKLSHGKYKLD